MVQPSLRALWSPPARLAYAAAWSLVGIPDTARASAPLADALPTEFCGSALLRLAEVGEALGYDLHGEGPVSRRRETRASSAASAWMTLW
ncbi:hypothetical protein SAMN02745121_06198 [Nannocystis exedens]|uniref:Uncharacterized protein n=1 Tax=Nannocystis exedens TaxID=54 RepID=A0A1I2EQR0_9BACT|nr:hypothetical protein [Nannocystis exedens]PCC73883.1 hypothetical protein NAEX_06971 [Nannocystis exedens]SFE94836.1 hypothetical protein SAMN02745121_06198 [Nannocystis exedens]